MVKDRYNLHVLFGSGKSAPSGDWGAQQPASIQAAYQKTCNIFFHKDIKSAVASQQKQLDIAKAKLQKLDQAS
ncbi:unnamed protein product [Triticum turgidum subsp. durum]|uniref:Uncharacterized protein n=1 Tax=Triticum turgidum subsp. durum TaxID=4567 RepID=A0A9R0WQD7_TRITD|nr:unnamed protein product [Triticum turgidum subsp. durum]